MENLSWENIFIVDACKTFYNSISKVRFYVCYFVIVHSYINLYGLNSLAPLTLSASKAGAQAVKSDDKATDISQLYQIFPDEVLGSGQFGIVYGGKWHGGESAFSLLTLGLNGSTVWGAFGS